MLTRKTKTPRKCRKKPSSHEESPNHEIEGKCAICISTITNRGRLNTCTHSFCFDCIKAWSKISNTCPSCRVRFTQLIGVTKTGKQKQVIGIAAKDQIIPEYYQADQSWALTTDGLTCMICGSGEDDEVMLRCDTCDNPFHTYCLNPPVDQIPGGGWHCDRCQAPQDVEPGLSDELFNRDLDLSSELFKAPKVLSQPEWDDISSSPESKPNKLIENVSQTVSKAESNRCFYAVSCKDAQKSSTRKLRLRKLEPVIESRSPSPDSGNKAKLQVSPTRRTRKCTVEDDVSEGGTGSRRAKYRRISSDGSKSKAGTSKLPNEQKLQRGVRRSK